MKPPLFATLSLAAGLLASCEAPPPPLQGEALEARRREIRTEVERALVDPAGALMSDEAYVIRDPELLAAASAEVLERCEPWMDGDLERLRFFMEGHLNGARERLLENDAGIRELSRLIAVRHAKPHIERNVVSLPGREANEIDRAIAHFGGLILSGRPSAPQPVPPVEYVEVLVDFGILPAPLERNESGKNHTLPVRFARDGNPWVHPDDPSRPSDAVAARLLLEGIAAAPEASRIVVRMTVLPALGSARTWDFIAERESSDGDSIRLTFASAPDTVRTMTVRELEELAATAPR